MAKSAKKTGKTSTRSAKVKRKASSKLQVCRFLAVPDLGPDADYSDEPRSLIELYLNFSLNHRTCENRIRQTYRTILFRMGLIGSDERPLVWLLDEDGHPTLFLSGRIAVLDGTTDKNDAAKFGDSIFSQICKPQAEHQVDLLVRARGGFDVEACSDDDETITDDEACELEYEALDDLFSEMDVYWLADSNRFDDEESWWAEGEGWKRLKFDLPFAANGKDSKHQLQFAIGAALATISETAMSGVEPNGADHDVWLLENDVPILNLSLLLERRNGLLNPTRYRKDVEKARKIIPSHLLTEAA